MVAVEQCRNTPKTPHNVPQYTDTGTATEEKSLPPAAGLGWKGGEPAANGDPTAHLDSNRAGWMRSSFRAEFAQGWAFFLLPIV